VSFARAEPRLDGVQAFVGVREQYFTCAEGVLKEPDQTGIDLGPSAIVDHDPFALATPLELSRDSQKEWSVILITRSWQSQDLEEPVCTDRQVDLGGVDCDALDDRPHKFCMIAWRHARPLRRPLGRTLQGDFEILC